MPPVSNTFVTPDGTQTHYLESGNAAGPLIICLHGLGGSSTTFLPLLPHIPESYNPVLVDYPGYGKAPRNASRKVTIAGLVSDLCHLIEHLQPKTESKSSKIIIFGHSLGTIVGMHYAAQFPSKVAGLFLLGAGRSASHLPAVRERMLDTARKARFEGIEVVAKQSVSGNFPNDEQRFVPASSRQAVYNAVAAADPEAYAQTCEAIVDEDHIDPDYTRIECPSVFVAGDMDGISPVHRSTDISRLLGGSSSVEIVKSGHQPIIDDIDNVVQAMQKLLTQLTIL